MFIETQPITPFICVLITLEKKKKTCFLNISPNDHWDTDYRGVFFQGNWSRRGGEIWLLHFFSFSFLVSVSFRERRIKSARRRRLCRAYTWIKATSQLLPGGRRFPIFNNCLTPWQQRWAVWTNNICPPDCEHPPTTPTFPFFQRGRG